MKIEDLLCGTCLAKWKASQEGPAVGTVAKDAGGNLAVRVVEDGLTKWKVTDPSTGGSWEDLQPNLDGYEILSEAGAPVVTDPPTDIPHSRVR